MTLFEKSTSMQIIPFPAHYQSIYINFDISSFSLISCPLILHVSSPDMVFNNLGNHKLIKQYHITMM